MLGFNLIDVKSGPDVYESVGLSLYVCVLLSYVIR